MLNKRIVFYLTPWGKKILFMLAAVLILTILLNATFFVRLGKNPLDSRCILIDPGHGGVDGGAVSGAVMEKDINLQLSLELKKLLEARGAYVEMTRQEDIALGTADESGTGRHLRDLTARLNRVNSGKFDIFLSIHVNRASSETPIGPMVLYSAHLPVNTFLAADLQESLNRHTSQVLHHETRRQPVKSDAFLLLNAKTPGVLIETGFLSNPRECGLLQDPAYREKLAQAVISGLGSYFSKDECENPLRRKEAPAGGEREIPIETLNNSHMAQIK